MQLVILDSDTLVCSLYPLFPQTSQSSSNVQDFDYFTIVLCCILLFNVIKHTSNQIRNQSGVLS